LTVAVREVTVTAIAKRVERASPRLSTLSLQRMQETLPWFDAMSADVRSLVGLLVQSGIVAFAQWLRAPAESARLTGEVFASAPREMARVVTLEQTVELVRVAVEVTEESVGDLATESEQVWLRVATLRFSREVAFAAALVYARAAEQRGAWDARLEASVVDAIVRGEVDDETLSRAAALGWSQPSAVTVIAGRAKPGHDPEQLVEEVHGRGSAVGADALAGVQSQRLVVLLGSTGRLTRAVRSVLPAFAPGPVVTGPVVSTLSDATGSARAAFAGLRAVAAWPAAPRPVSSDALLVERALTGDDDARRQLVDEVYRPLADREDDLLETVATFVSGGGSIEGAARKLFVHPNTVRYRLQRAGDICNLNLHDPRGQFVAQLAVAVGRLDGSSAPL
jgi:DNA-binding PucR family transcriptional regulator